MEDKIYAMLGLCTKAGKLAYGSDMCEEKIKYNKVSMLIIAKDASINTKNKFVKLCENKVECIIWGDVDKISHYIGKENKAVIAILDKGFGTKIQEMIRGLKGANN